MKTSILYHWKKFLVSLTAFLWSACDNSADASEIYIETPSYGVPLLSSSSETIDQSSSSIGESSSSSEMDKFSSSFSAVYAPPTVFCYNDTAVNSSGKVFETISCENGEKFLRTPQLYNDIPESRSELPEGVQVNAPIPGQGGLASNCQRVPDTCIDGVEEDEYGNLKPIGGCYPTIDCPEKEPKP